MYRKSDYTDSGIEFKDILGHPTGQGAVPVSDGRLGASCFEQAGSFVSEGGRAASFW